MEINLENIHFHISYENLLDDDDTACVSWDFENEDIDKIMSDENQWDIKLEKRKNLIWIEEIKKKFNWKKGVEVYIEMKQNCDGCFYCWAIDKDAFPDFIIEKSGYASIRTYNNYTRDENDFVRVDSVYNDMICDTHLN